MKSPSTICEPTQTELRRIMAMSMRDRVVGWWDENPLRRVSLEQAILQAIDAAMDDESEDYDGQAEAEGRHSYQFTKL